jgi:hypothetical protein
MLAGDEFVGRGPGVCGDLCTTATGKAPARDAADVMVCPATLDDVRSEGQCVVHFMQFLRLQRPSTTIRN